MYAHSTACACDKPDFAHDCFLLFSPSSSLILFVADLFQPVGGLAVETFLNGDVRHGRGCRGTVPVFLTRLEPDHVTRPNFLDRTTPALYPAAASRHDQGLAKPGGCAKLSERRART